ncbi:HTH domain-containing protein, partial [Enterococcus faecalis]|nr:HTH domain-containing protein [Enterococcus faecalis]
MNFNVFLDEDQRYKYYIVKLLELKQNTFFSQAQLMEALGVSKYKIDRFLKDIEEDSELLNLQISIVVDTSGEIRAQGFNNLVTKKLRLYYLEQSKQYQLLYEMLVGSNQSAESLATKLYVSRASIYNELKILKDNLKIYGLKVKNLKIVGRELKVRSFFFSLFNDFYCGITKPFSQKLNKRINSFK